ncbi:hypothetical protein [Hyphococcus sp.]|uniref:hypothetical protein n=1 Tax=Hyphococcus sp. TaxID=2038636 RepID=UPI003D1253D1
MNTTIMTAVAAAAILIALPSSAAELRPDQKEAVEKMLAQLEPSMREPMRAQIEQSVAMLNKEQVAMLVASMEDADNGAQEMTDESVEEEAPAASPEDLAYNKKQYEPVIRANWQAQKSFDAFVDGELAAKCPSRDQYAVFGSGYRYELRQLAPNWPRASDNVDADVAILSGSYAPQDGRYQFDFSKVRTSYDKAKVSAAVASACAQWTKEAAAFHAKAKPLQAAEDFNGLHALEQSSHAKVEPIEAALNEVLEAQAPAGDYALYTALQNGQRIN